MEGRIWRWGKDLGVMMGSNVIVYLRDLSCTLIMFNPPAIVH